MLLLRLLKLSKLLSEQAVLIPLHLELWTQPNIGLDLSLRLLIEARHIFLTVLHWESLSLTRTRCPQRAGVCVRLTATVVFPKPPLLFTIEMMLPTRCPPR